MAESNIVAYSEKDVEKENGTKNKAGLAEVELQSSGTSADNASQNGTTSLVPLRMKLLSILLVTAVGFGSHWSSGVTGAMKSTLKKVSRRTSTQHRGPALMTVDRNCTSTIRNSQCLKLARTS
jgi:hypothetical protein